MRAPRRVHGSMGRGRRERRVICQPCAEAADWNPAQPLYRGLEAVAADERRQAHLLCLGAGSCACQHRVLDVVVKPSEGSSDA